MRSSIRRENSRCANNIFYVTANHNDNFSKFNFFLVLSAYFARDTMLARCLLSSCVCLSVNPSVGPSQVGTVSKRLDELSSCLAWRLPFTYPTISKNKGTSFWNFVPNSGLRKFRHGKSIALSTKLVVVDGRVCRRHLYDNRQGVVAVYYKSINQL